MPHVRLRPAYACECAFLSDLCLRSKAFWGYDAAFLDSCRRELSLEPDDLTGDLVQVAEVSGAVAGMVQLAVGSDECHLDKLFVDPAFMKCGIGKRLLGWAVARASEIGVERLMIDADPGAVAFYRKMGATEIGSVPSGSVPGRFLPRLTLDVAGFPGEAVVRPS